MNVLLRRFGFFVLLLTGIAIGLYSAAALYVAVASVWHDGLNPAPADLRLTLLFFAAAIAGLIVAAACGWGVRRLYRQRG